MESREPQLLTETPTSRIYTVAHAHQTVVLKLLAASETEEQTGALAPVILPVEGRSASCVPTPGRT